MNSNASPWNVFVPDLVTALTAAAEWCPYCAGSALVSTLNSCIASGNGSGRFRLLNGSLCVPPSSRYVIPFDRPPATTIVVFG